MNLPPHIRFNRKYIILASVWYGPSKPDTNILLKPTLSKLNLLHTIGTTIDGRKTMKSKLLLCVFDLPARAMAVNMKQFNGYYGCLKCLDKGEHINNRHLYLPTEPHTKRTMAMMILYAAKALVKGVSIYGVKGPSVLSEHIDIVIHVVIDYMHCVLLGVVKQLLDMWLDSSNSSYDYYIGPSKAKIVIEYLLNLKPPDNFRIHARSLFERAHWKASEYRAWLLYYSLPILVTILPGDYVHHYALLVCSMHVLLNDVITVEDLKFSKKALNAFYELLPTLYSQHACSANMHALIHLPQCVAQWGPLWGFSMFGHESYHSNLKRKIHGTRNVLPQICRFMKLDYLHDSFTPLPNSDIIVGKCKQTVLLPDEIKAFEKIGIEVTGPVVKFKGLKRLYDVIHSYKHKAVKNGSICEIEPGDTFISVQCFCQVQDNTYAFGYLFTNKQGVLYDTSTSDELINLHLADSITHRFFNLVDKLQLQNVVVVHVNSLLRKCIHIPMNDSDCDIIVPLVNVFEHH